MRSVCTRRPSTSLALAQNGGGFAAQAIHTAVTPFKFTLRSKAQLGVDFLALVETNRFKYWQEESEFDDA
jgi:hypothetical protein